MSDNLPSHVYGVIIDLADSTLILPNSAVVEVLGQDALEAKSGGADWLLGELKLELDSIPVVSLEGLWGQAIPQSIRRSRIVVLKAPNRDERIAIMARSYPLIVTLNEVALKALPIDTENPRDYVLSHVQVANRQAWIPDVDAMVFASNA
ncbi:MAG: chemotaxis protein CheW [Oceanococcus sp.]